MNYTHKVYLIGDDLWKIKQFDQQICALVPSAARGGKSTHINPTIHQCRVGKGAELSSQTVSDVFQPTGETCGSDSYVTQSLWWDTNVGHNAFLAEAVSSVDRGAMIQINVR